MKKVRTYIEQYDYNLFFAFFVLIFIGLYMQLNISSIRTQMIFFYRQFAWFILSMVSLFIAFKKINLEKIRKYSFLFVVLTILALIAVLIFGSSVKGAVRSIRIWKINFQPSLIARIVVIIYFAHILEKKKRVIPYTTPKYFFSNFLALIVIPAVIFLLILVERHFSTLVISSITLISLLFLAKVRYSTIFSLIGILLFLGIMVLFFGPKYRSDRIKIYKEYSLFFPSEKRAEDKELNDYQIRESLISLSAGKIFGTSPSHGTGKHYFLPEAKTDYIFAIIGEEFGFLGALMILLLYAFLFLRSILNANKQKDLFLQLLCLGLGMNIFFNAIINIGVAMAALPSTGVTLPFISYGGTSLLVNSFSIGLLLNISARRRKI